MASEEIAATVYVEGTGFETVRRRIREALVEAGVAQQPDETVDALLLRMV